MKIIRYDTSELEGREPLFWSIRSSFSTSALLHFFDDKRGWDERTKRIRSGFKNSDYLMMERMTFKIRRNLSSLASLSKLHIAFVISLEVFN